MSMRYRDRRSNAALDEFRESVVAIPRIGVHTNAQYYMSLLARAYQRAGRIDDGLAVLDDAQLSIEARGERWWAAEIQRLRGELLLSRSADNADQAEACFERALEISRNQEARSVELRAVTSLARLWQSRDKTAEARDLLAPVYAWFTEGFDTVDLKEAKALIDGLSRT